MPAGWRVVTHDGGGGRERGSADPVVSRVCGIADQGHSQVSTVPESRRIGREPPEPTNDVKARSEPLRGRSRPAPGTVDHRRRRWTIGSTDACRFSEATAIPGAWTSRLTALGVHGDRGLPVRLRLSGDAAPTECDIAGRHRPGIDEVRAGGSHSSLASVQSVIEHGGFVIEFTGFRGGSGDTAEH